VRTAPRTPASLILAHALLRIAAGADGALVGLFLARLSRGERGIHAGIAGILGATAYGAELVASTPLGMAADAMPVRYLMPCGALISAVGTRLFAVSVGAPLLFVSRLLQGLGVAAVSPPLLGYLARITQGAPVARARVMSFFEISMLAGLALGALVGAQAWQRLGTGAFSLVASLDVLSAAWLLVVLRRASAPLSGQPLRGLAELIRHPAVHRLAPSWICVNVVVGLWLGPTLTFLLTGPARGGQRLDGLFADMPGKIGWVLLAYALLFAAGVTLWSRILPRVRPTRALQISLLAMLGASVSLYGLNHGRMGHSVVRAALLAITALCVLIESGFTPAALSLLAATLETVSAKGAAMGIYSTLLGIGAVIGSLLAGLLGQAAGMDGLLGGTVLMSCAALLWLPREPGRDAHC
jgi:predicted MFS family arabinose efflux permease